MVAGVSGVCVWGGEKRLQYYLVYVLLGGANISLCRPAAQSDFGGLRELHDVDALCREGPTVLSFRIVIS